MLLDKHQKLMADLCTRTKCEWESDKLWAVAARRLGLDSVQILNGPFGPPELILTAGACSDPAKGVGPLRSACPAADVELRTGWRATRPCECDPSDVIINCALTRSRATWWPENQRGGRQQRAGQQQQGGARQQGGLQHAGQERGAQQQRGTRQHGGQEASAAAATQKAATIATAERRRERVQPQPYLSLLVARQDEGAGWALKLAKSDPRVAVRLCSTGRRALPPVGSRRSSTSISEMVVANTGREAGCHVAHLLELVRAAAAGTPLPPLTAFVQAKPHCRDPTFSGGQICVDELVPQLLNLSAAELDAR